MIKQRVLQESDLSHEREFLTITMQPNSPTDSEKKHNFFGSNKMYNKQHQQNVLRFTHKNNNKKRPIKHSTQKEEN